MSKRIGLMLNRDQLKLLAVVPMTLSHIADVFLFPESLPDASVWFLLFNIAGYMTAPVMCLMMAQGYQYTRDRWKYFFRVLAFAAVSHVPFTWCHGYGWLNCRFNMFFTFAIALLSLICHDSIRNKAVRTVVIALLVALTVFTEWSFTAVLWIFAFYYFRGDRKKMFISGMIIFSWQIVVMCSLWHFRMGGSWLSSALLVLGQTLVVALSLLIGLFRCSGERGRHPKLMKWFFYLYYPAHFALIGLAAKIIKK